MNVTIPDLAAGADRIALVSGFLHDSVIFERGTLRDRMFSMRLGRIGYELGRQLERHWLLGQRWFYPWIECELLVSEVDGVEETKELDGGDLDDSLHVIYGKHECLVLGRMFGDTKLRVTRSSELRVHDTGTEPIGDRGLVLHGRPFDLSAIRELM